MLYTTYIDKHGDPNARGTLGQLPSVTMHEDGTLNFLYSLDSTSFLWNCLLHAKLHLVVQLLYMCCL
jgi:Cu/Zn superoxide dismutase